MQRSKQTLIEDFGKFKDEISEKAVKFDNVSSKLNLSIEESRFWMQTYQKSF